MIQNIDKYIELTIEREKYYNAGKIGKANKIFDKVREIYTEWREDPNTDLKELAPLLNHEYDCVRLKTAYLLIGIVPEAEKTLKELEACGSADMSFNAFMILKLWKEGDLK